MFDDLTYDELTSLDHLLWLGFFRAQDAYEQGALVSDLSDLAIETHDSLRLFRAAQG